LTGRTIFVKSIPVFWPIIAEATDPGFLCVSLGLGLETQSLGLGLGLGSRSLGLGLGLDNKVLTTFKTLLF